MRSRPAARGRPARPRSRGRRWRRRRQLTVGPAIGRRAVRVGADAPQQRGPDPPLAGADEAGPGASPPLFTEGDGPEAFHPHGRPNPGRQPAVHAVFLAGRPLFRPLFATRAVATQRHEALAHLIVAPLAHALGTCRRRELRVRPAGGRGTRGSGRTWVPRQAERRGTVRRATGRCRPPAARARSCFSGGDPRARSYVPAAPGVQATHRGIE